MDTESTRALIEQVNDARLNGNTEKLAALLAEDVVWALPIGFRDTEAGMVRGRDNVAQGLTGGSGSLMQSILKVDSIERSILKMVVEGDTAVGFHKVSAELVKGGNYSNEYVWRYTCADGMVTRIYEYADTLHSSKQMGDVPLFED